MDNRTDTPQNWLPPFCPNPYCKHHNTFTDRRDFKKTGFFYRRRKPHRIQRFTCRHCRRSFSSQTFCTTYWQKRPDLDPAIFMKTIGCMANRQIARDLNVSPSTVDRHVSRLGRHCLLFHAKMMARAAPPAEIVIDGFETFEFSQYYPFHHNLAVEPQTGFFLWFTDSELRRKGRMTGYQRQRRRQLEQIHGRPDPRAVRKGIAELLRQVLRGGSQAVIRSDDHRAYPAAMRGLACRIEHRVTSSRERRDQRNDLWEVNLLDLLIRHSSANHKRETIAWSKRRQGSAERLAILLVWRDYVKWRWEKGCRRTPAMERGMLPGRLGVKEILHEREFRTRVELPGRWSEYYDRSVETRALGINLKHELSYAY